MMIFVNILSSSINQDNKIFCSLYADKKSSMIYFSQEAFYSGDKEYPSNLVFVDIVLRGGGYIH